MTRTEDRLADALGASARTVREDLLHSPVIPPHRDRHWARWLAPAAAAAVIALVTVLVAVLTGGSPAQSPAVGAGGAPRYYVELDSHGKFLIRSTVSGAVTATAPVPAAANAGDAGVAAAANGTFFAAAFISGS